ncbi:hypothetical protein LEP1GSC062_2592 [Leptospira alexanderi serovar Manhao 3 str. L 60]|uniref:Uncharacterized protein n=1 Tax=Leptospira alexanderi serovar Manhao 3 str. L 60 TaxID=1049759 RepID=V6IBP2_9LEPT|nr:hypothetical protein LEP1GSC062_2592 [Leptospira alexanderi serovar Manhao 3 str. L 60]
MFAEFRKALRLSSGSRCTLVSYSPKRSYAELTFLGKSMKKKGVLQIPNKTGII